MSMDGVTQIILASSSPRRRQLLEMAEIPFSVLTMDTDESFPAGLDPAHAAKYVARTKASAVYDSDPFHDRYRGAMVLAADTMVVLADEILGKPRDRLEAIQMISRLSGSTHRVITGVCLMGLEQVSTFSEETEVSFRALAEDEITHYVDTYRPYDKAGAYAIQEWIGIIGITSIHGDYYNVMGLPVSRIMTELKRLLPGRFR
jgi:septum formation protein